MCDSTSVKSRMITPLTSNSRTDSFGPSAHATTSFNDGNALPHSSSRPSLNPPWAASSANITGQVLSRAALEISHAPTISLAASLAVGACAWAGAEACDKQNEERTLGHEQSLTERETLASG